MRKNIIAGNWKMNKTPQESTQLVEETLQLLAKENIVETIVIFCPPFIAIERVAGLVKGKKNIFYGPLQSMIYCWETFLSSPSFIFLKLDRAPTEETT